MNSHELIYDCIRNSRQPVSAPVIQADLSPKLSYALVHSCLNDLVRCGKIKEGRSEIGKRVFSIE